MSSRSQGRARDDDDLVDRERDDGVEPHTDGHAVDEGRGDRAALPWLFRRGSNLAWALVVLGGIGLAASFFLTIEYLHKLQQPDAALVCDINLFITCGPAMDSWAGSVLGFPNIIIGLVSFTVPITLAMGLFAGARYRRWIWIGLEIGLIGGAVLITFLQWFSGYELARLCMWCMIIWAATIPLVVVTTIYNLAHGHFGAAAVRAGRALAPWAITIVIIWYLAVAGFVAAGMWNVIMLSLV